MQSDTYWLQNKLRTKATKQKPRKRRTISAHNNEYIYLYHVALLAWRLATARIYYRIKT